MKVMNEVIDSCAFSDFCGIGFPNQIPDGDIIGRLFAYSVYAEIPTIIGIVLYGAALRKLVIYKNKVEES